MIPEHVTQIWMDAPEPGHTHKLARIIDSGSVPMGLPLCWDMDLKQRGVDQDDEGWYLAWDLGAIDPMGLAFGRIDDVVDCQGCLEWMHS